MPNNYYSLKTCLLFGKKWWIIPEVYQLDWLAIGFYRHLIIDSGLRPSPTISRLPSNLIYLCKRKRPLPWYNSTWLPYQKKCFQWINVYQIGSYWSFHESSKTGLRVVFFWRELVLRIVKSWVRMCHGGLTESEGSEEFFSENKVNTEQHRKHKQKE